MITLRTTSGRATSRGAAARRHTRRSVIAVTLAAALAVAGLVVGPRVIGQASARTVAGSPVGSAEHLWFRPGGMRFIGWAVDPSTTNPISIYVTVDGKKIGSSVANGTRPDLVATHPQAIQHGFYASFTIPEGPHTVCIWAGDVGAGADTQLRCQRRTLDYGPIGTLDYLRTAPGSITVKGWAYDLDQPMAPVTVGMTVDGTPSTLVAMDPRPDLARTTPAAGPNHGFALTVPVAQGLHRVCVTAINVGYGSDNALNCTTLNLAESPRGHLDLFRVEAGQLHLRGWALDPDQFSAVTAMTLTVDGRARRVLADLPRSDVGRYYRTAYTRHGFDLSLTLAEGSHQVCLSAHNISYGSDTSFGCRTVALTFTPTASLDAPATTPTGVRVAGWATDPDTTAAIPVRLSVDGRSVTVTANRAGGSHSGHRFLAALRLTSGVHRVCAVGVNVRYGNHDSAASCRTVTLAFSPIGYYDALVRDSATGGLRVTGWAADADTALPIYVDATLDGVPLPAMRASAVRTDVGRRYPDLGSAHGLQVVVPASPGEHTVCLTARNAGGGGSNTSLGCKLVIAVNPVAPSAPTAVTATPSYGAATVMWTAPATDGGAPWTRYVVTASPGGATTAAAANATSVAIIGLKSGASYTFTVVAVNVAGASPATSSATVTTLTGPAPQRTPAPVSTSRYIRNVRGSSAAELAVLRAEGFADAQANPAGHSYLQLLDIGGQDQYDGGVVLSATTRFVSYGDLVRDVQAYIDGYHAGQRTSAPVTIAIGTNNDMEVSSASGVGWARSVVNPLVSYARTYSGVRIAGANDIEPGFRASYAQTKAWMSGYLGATSAPFVFNGSADGCAWTVTNRSCNNGWSMAGLYYVAQGMAPARSTNLPQVYNSTMAAQWKYISLTGVGQGNPRINFGGPLTEWTACAQSGSCGSLTGRTAWSMMWSNLQSDSRLKVSSLPYSTDLRIDR